MSPKLKMFYKRLKAVAAPKIIADGYEWDSKKTFRKTVDLGECEAIQIVEFQVGHKGFSIGRFTVNIGVYAGAFRPDDWHDLGAPCLPGDCLPDQWKRLGFLRTPPKSIWNRLFGNTPDPYDYWWPQHEAEGKMDRVMNEVVELILGKGQEWMDTHTSLESLQKSFDSLEKGRSKRAR